MYFWFPRNTLWREKSNVLIKKQLQLNNFCQKLFPSEEENNNNRNTPTNPKYKLSKKYFLIEKTNKPIQKYKTSPKETSNKIKQTYK